MKKMQKTTNAEKKLEALCESSILLIKEARQIVYRNINKAETLTNFIIGSWIVEVEQEGAERAKYGQRVIKKLSERLTQEFGKGYMPETIKNIRKFYLTYRNRICKPPVTLSGMEKGKPLVSFFSNKEIFQLPWTHYLILMRMKDELERSFYEHEAINSGWSKRELQRQYNSSLYERLLLSKDKNKVMELAKKGLIVEKPEDAVKDPYVLEFLGIRENSSYSETDLESRIINHIQDFLMEMGKGFTFVGRQVRFTFDEDHFRIDLVLYNRLLRCFVLVDLKAGKLKHQDLGQMQMYVNYYDRYEKTEDENPTIGILLCSEKNDNMVELTLPVNSNIYASKYETYLPDKKLLQSKLQEWISEETEIKSKK
ncbi:DUF1016 family protein [bacterium]|nr:DUF1016 family protein [bacterium]